MVGGVGAGLGVWEGEYPPVTSERGAPSPWWGANILMDGCAGLPMGLPMPPLGGFILFSFCRLLQ